MRIAGFVFVLGLAACASVPAGSEGATDDGVQVAALAGTPSCPMMRQGQAGGGGGHGAAMHRPNAAGNAERPMHANGGRGGSDACPMHANGTRGGSDACPMRASTAADGGATGGQGCRCAMHQGRAQPTAAETSVPEAMQDGYGSPAGAADPVARGREIFLGRGNCSTCHGPEGEGTALAPNLTDETWLHGDGSTQAVHRIVMHGIAAPRVHPQPMPAKGGAELSHQDVMDVSAYVLTLDD